MIEHAANYRDDKRNFIKEIKSQLKVRPIRFASSSSSSNVVQQVFRVFVAVHSFDIKIICNRHLLVHLPPSATSTTLCAPHTYLLCITPLVYVY